jgi:WD40 repeat protein
VDSQTGTITLISSNTWLQKWLLDGRMVVTGGAAGNSNTYLIRLDRPAPPQELSSVPLIAISPDGRFAATWGVTFPQPRNVILFPIDDPDAQTTFNIPGDVQSVDWSTDGEWLAVASLLGLGTEASIFVGMVGDPDDFHDLGSAGLYAWSPHGDQIALANRQGISIFDATSGSLRSLSLPASLSPMLESLHPSQWFPPSLAWSSDSQFLALIVNGSTVVLPVNGEGGIQMVGARFYAWIPGIDSLVVSGPVCVPQERLMIVTADGGIEKTFDDRPSGNPLLSSDGNSLAFVAVDLSSQKGQVKIADLQNGTEHLLFAGAGQIIQWSADGKSIAFSGSTMGPFCPGRDDGKLEISPLQ